ITSLQVLRLTSVQYSIGVTLYAIAEPLTLPATLYRPVRTQAPDMAATALLLLDWYWNVFAPVTAVTTPVFVPMLFAFMLLVDRFAVVMMSFTTRPWLALVTVTVVLPLARTKALVRFTHLRYDPFRFWAVVAPVL